MTYWFLFNLHLFLFLDSGSHQFKYPPCPLIIESSLRPLALGDLWVCLFIEDLISKQIEWLQDFILECLHQHTFFTLSFRQDIQCPSNMYPFMFKPNLGCMLTIQLMLSMFQLSLTTLSIALQFWFKLPPFNYGHVSLCLHPHGSECKNTWHHSQCFHIQCKGNWFSCGSKIVTCFPFFHTLNI